jgi:putative hydrolase
MRLGPLARLPGAAVASTSMLPAEALRRIAFLLEAEGEASYKSRAFRRAAAAVEAVAPSELEELRSRQQLASLPGLGATTAAVVSQSLSGSVPEYLRALEERTLASLPEPARQLLGRLHGDLHSHSDWSDGGSPIEEMARAAAALGHQYLALTDHSPRLTVAHGLSAESLCRQLEVVRRVNQELDPFRLLSGIEVDILEDGSLDQAPELLAELDVVVASVHSKLRMGPAEMTRRMVAAVSNPHVDVLGHCTGRILAGRGRPPSTFDHEVVFAACAANGTAVEINARPERRDPPEALLRAAARAGCRFAIDSDAHAPGQLSWLHLGCEQAAQAAIGAEAIVNTSPLAELLDWTRRRE